MAGPTAKPFLKSFLFAAIVFIVWVAAMFLTLGAPGTPEGAGRVVGHILFVVLIPALITALWARFSGRAWSIWRIGITFFVLLVLIAFLSFAGRLNNTNTAGLERAIQSDDSLALRNTAA